MTNDAGSIYSDIFRWYTDPVKIAFIRERGFQYSRTATSESPRDSIEYACAFVDVLHQRLTMLTSTDTGVCGPVPASSAWTRFMTVDWTKVDFSKHTVKEVKGFRNNIAKGRLILAVETACRKYPPDPFLIDMVQAVAKVIESIGRCDRDTEQCSPPKAIPAPADFIDKQPGTLHFDEQGHLHQAGVVPVSRYLDEVRVQLNRFLARLTTCQKTKSGHFLMRDSTAGELRGVKILWENTELIAQASIAMLVAAPKWDEMMLEAQRKDGIAIKAGLLSPRTSQAVVDVLSQITFAIPRDGEGKWPRQIPATTVDKLRLLNKELSDLRDHFELQESLAVQNAANARPGTPFEVLATTTRMLAHMGDRADDAGPWVDAIGLFRANPTLPRLPLRTENVLVNLTNLEAWAMLADKGCASQSRQGNSQELVHNTTAALQKADVISVEFGTNVQVPGQVGSQSKEVEKPSSRVIISDDFRVWTVAGTRYTFTLPQGACMRAMWRLSKEGTQAFAHASVFDVVASEEWAKIKRKRLDHVFRIGRADGKERFHKAWTLLIRRQADTQGFYELVIK